LHSARAGDCVSYLIIAGVIVVGVYLLAPRWEPIPEFTQQARDYWECGRHEIAELVEYFSLASNAWATTRRDQQCYSQRDRKVSLTVSGVLTSIAGWVIYIPWLILIPILSFFFLKDAENLSPLRPADAAARKMALAR